jgi:hypothetical protein
MSVLKSTVRKSMIFIAAKEILCELDDFDDLAQKIL